MDYRNLLRAAAAAASDGEGDRDGEADACDSPEGYRPPTEAELKVLKARRDRSDKIAKRMGECLLQGWRMLDSLCQQCGTILMMPPREGEGEGQTYCIACRELESDVSKDDPAQSADAARAQAREARVAASSDVAPTITTMVAAVGSVDMFRRLQSTTLDRLEFYRLRLLASAEPKETEQLLGTLERLLGFLDRLESTGSDRKG